MTGKHSPAPTHVGERAAPVSYLPVICLALIFFISSWNTRERPLVLFAVPVLMWLFYRSLRRPIPQPGAAAIIVGALVLLGYDMLSPRAVGQGQPDPNMINAYGRVINAVWIVFAVTVLYRVRKGLKLDWKWRAAIIAVAAILSAGLIVATPEPSIDVWHLHQEAGEALLSGDNPYSDIRVFASSDVGEEARIMTGYPYTPPNLLVFGTSAAATGDSRWLSLACWLGFLALFGTVRPQSPSGTALLLFLASQPAWHVVLEIAYTETVTLVLLAGAIVVWRNRRRLGPILLGLALASKQYLVVLAPMVLASRLVSIRSRLTVLISAVAATAVGFIWGVGDYLDAIVAYHLRVPPQDHSVSLYGVSYFFEIPFVIPSFVGLIASVVVGLVAARTARTPSQILIGAAAALGIGFFLATQAYVNYWFLVGSILALAFLLADPPGNEARIEVLDRSDSNAVNA